MIVTRMDDNNNSYAANRARRASLACISLGIPTSNTHVNRLPGKPTDVATRRRMSMTADLDCPAFLRNNYAADAAPSASHSSPAASRSSNSGHGVVRGVIRTGSGDSSKLVPTESKRSSHHHQQQRGSHHRATADGSNGHRSRSSTSNSSHLPSKSSDGPNIHAATGTPSGTNKPSLSLGLLPSARLHRSRKSRSASMSSISSSQKEQLLVHHNEDPSKASSPRKSSGRRRGTMLATSTSSRSSSHANSTCKSPRRQSCCQTSSTLANDQEEEEEAGPEITSSTPCVYEFDDEDDIEEFGGDHDNSEEAWPSPFEANSCDVLDEEDAVDAEAKTAVAQRHRRHERQRMRNPAAAAASTVLNTRRQQGQGQRPQALPETTTSRALPAPAPAPLVRSSSCEASSSKAPQKQMFGSNTDPHYRDIFKTSFGNIPLTEPKKEILFTPSGHKRSVSLTASEHAAALFKASAITLTPSLHKKSPGQDGSARRVPRSADAAPASRSVMRSKSHDHFDVSNDLYVPSFHSPAPSSSATKSNPHTPPTVSSLSSGSKQSTPTLSSRSASSRDSKSSSKEGSSSSSNGGHHRSAGGATMSARAAPGSKLLVARAKSMDQFTTRDFLMLSPLGTMHEKVKASNSSSSALLKSLGSSRAKPNEASVSFDTIATENRESNDRELCDATLKQQDDSDRSPRAPRRTVSGRSSRSRRASMGEDGKLHRQGRRTEGSEDVHVSPKAQQSVVLTATRSRRRQSLSHAPSSDARPAVSNVVRSSRRVSMSSGPGADGGVNAVVTTMTRMKEQSPANSSDTEDQSVHMMNW